MRRPKHGPAAGTPYYWYFCPTCPGEMYTRPELADKPCLRCQERLDARLQDAVDQVNRNEPTLDAAPDQADQCPG